MLNNKCYKKISCILLVLLQVLLIIPYQPSYAVAGVDDLPEPRQVERRLLLTSKDLFLDEVFKDPKFIKDWAQLAHILGIGWCSGTESNRVGEDFSVKKVTTLNDADKYRNDFKGYNKLPFWVIEANYDENDPYSEGWRSDERLKIFISEADVMFDAETLEFGTALHSQLEPESVVSKIIRNNGTTNLTSVLQSDYSDTESTTVTHGANVSGSLGVKKSVTTSGKILGAGVESSTEVSFSLTAGYDYSKATMNSHVTSRMAQERVDVPPNTKMAATIYALKSKVSFPYQGDVVPVYNVTLSGFYRNKDNSAWGHDESRPDARISFGNFSYEPSDEAVEGMTALDDLFNQYKNRSIQGNCETDWQWVINKYNDDNFVKKLLGSIIKTRYVARINGRFNQVDGAIFDSDIKNLGALSEEDEGLPQEIDYDDDPVYADEPLEKPDTTSRVNLALNKDVTASGFMENNNPEKAVNGTINDINDCWKAKEVAGSYGEWLKVDLGERRKIDYVSIAHAGTFGFSKFANNRNFAIYISDDGETYRTVDGIQYNFDDRSNFDLNDDDVVGRYIKVNVTMPGMFDLENNETLKAASIYNLAIYGYDIDPNKYSINYKGNGHTNGQVPTDSDEYYQYDEVKILGNENNLEREGYDFIGWNTKPDGTGDDYKKDSNIIMEDRNMNLYAKWISTNDIAYKKSVTANHAISYHPASNAVNGTMNGINDKWCTNRDKGAQWLEVDLGADYNIDSWIVKHAGAYGESSGYNTKDFKLQKKVKNEWIDVDNVYDNTDNITKRNVNPFKARFIRLFVTEPSNNGNSAVRIFQFKVYGKRADKEKYHVYYKANGSLEGELPVDSNEYSEGDIVQISEDIEALVNPGFEFEGWNTLPDGNGEFYEAGSYINMISDDLTLFAQWRDNNEDINLTLNKEVYTSNEMDKHPGSSIVDGKISGLEDKWCTLDFPAVATVDLGDTYKINRWVVKHAEAGGESDDYNTKYYSLETSNGDLAQSDLVDQSYGMKFGGKDYVSNNKSSYTDRTLNDPVYARYVRLKVVTPTNISNDKAVRIYQFDVFGKPANKIKFNGSGHTTGSVPSEVYSSIGDKVSLPENNGMEKTGFNFIGWNTQPDGTGKHYNSTDQYIMGDSDVILYAQWRDEDIVNAALGKSVEQSSTIAGGLAEYAVDGKTNGIFSDGSVTLTSRELKPWWKVDLGSEYEINNILVHNRTDNYMDRLNDYIVTIYDNNMQEVWSNTETNYPNPVSDIQTDGVVGRYVKIQLSDRNYLSLAEVEVLGKEVSIKPINMMLKSLDMTDNHELEEILKKYSVKYDGNGQNLGTVPIDENEYEVGESVIVAENSNNLSKKGYNFIGWNTKASGDGITYDENMTFTMKEKDLVLFALWEEKEELIERDIIKTSYEEVESIEEEIILEDKEIESKGDNTLVEDQKSKTDEEKILVEDQETEIKEDQEIESEEDNTLVEDKETEPNQNK